MYAVSFTKFYPITLAHLTPFHFFLFHHNNIRFGIKIIQSHTLFGLTILQCSFIPSETLCSTHGVAVKRRDDNWGANQAVRRVHTLREKQVRAYSIILGNDIRPIQIDRSRLNQVLSLFEHITRKRLLNHHKKLGFTQHRDPGVSKSKTAKHG